MDIDDELMAKAMACTDASTKKAVVEAGLHLLIRLPAQGGIRRLRGKVQWEGNLEESRLDRLAEE